MQEQLITFETAVLAKEKGFDIPTQRAYINNNLFTNFEESYGESDFYFDADDFYETWNSQGAVFNKTGKQCFGPKADDIKWFEAYSAPTQSLLQKWLREVHKIHIIISSENNHFFFPNDKFGYAIKFDRGYTAAFTKFKIYEEALEVGLKEALKLIK